MSESIIAVERVTKQVQDSTGTLTILHEIDFTLAARQSAAIVGASGYAALELIRILARHPGARITAATSRQDENPRLDALHPSLTGRIDLLR